MKKTILAALALMLTACASNDNAEIAKNDDGYRCEKIYTLASKIPKKVCTNSAQRKHMEEKSKEALRERRNNPLTQSASSGTF
ncbi:hypothetical protein [Thalassomonas actiniarum]|uniref:Lipoprotein n=1 Tax=Thalassomonas actiniarum TaxID=485447 RepID=A0AAF0C2I9_9GAMM|nr:hypothetical protein [Thalassomonas actiniarum]WDD98557.1 hypothetical protein SG35_025435 [Thalassomonas actiniarum]